MWIWNCEVSSRSNGAQTAHATRARMIREYGENLAEENIDDSVVEVHLSQVTEPDGSVVFTADVIVGLDPRNYPNLVPEP